MGTQFEKPILKTCIEIVVVGYLRTLRLFAITKHKLKRGPKDSDWLRMRKCTTKEEKHKTNLWK